MNKQEAEQKTIESKQKAMNDAKSSTEGDATIRTINPFTGTEIIITPEDLEGVEKKTEADRERD